ncbi:MAG: hypothetical protein ACI4MQ_03590 [Candidatus Coproplasma sp.]
MIKSNGKPLIAVGALEIKLYRHSLWFVTLSLFFRESEIKVQKLITVLTYDAGIATPPKASRNDGGVTPANSTLKIFSSGIAILKIYGIIITDEK